MKFTNSDIKSFVEEHVNVKPEKVKAYRDQVNRLRNNLSDYLYEHPEYGLVKMLNSGSVAKGTALKTINDMDVAVYVKSSSVDTQDEIGLLKYVRSALVEIYTRYNMTEDQFSLGTHCVKVGFRGSRLDVDVVPVLYEDDDEDRGYLINKDTGVRVLTSIKLHLEFIRKRKNTHANFAQMVRVTKWWRDRQGLKFKSFLIELIWAHLADRIGVPDDIANALQQFFVYVRETELNEPIIFTDYYKSAEVSLQSGVPNIFDPVNPKNNAAGNLDTSRKQLIIDEVDRSLGLLMNARMASTKQSAEACLKTLLGPLFSL